jgi:hypothetical protein
MFLKEHNISVRLPQEKTIDTGIVFVQNDKDVYKLNIRVFDGVYEIDYTEVEEATITFSKADGNVVQGDMQIEADQLTYVLGTNEIAAPGKLIATIQLLGANERLTTARFVFNVEKDLITEDAVKSTSEFAILQQLKNELEEIDVVELRNEFEAHKAESVQDAGGVHGLEIEQGTWTPTLYGGTTSGSPVYSIRQGRYMRIGNLVYLSGRIDITSKGGLAGPIRISGLPFAGNNNITQNINVSEYYYLTFNGIPILQILQNANYMSFILVKTGSAATNITDADITDSFGIRFAGIYQIN